LSLFPTPKSKRLREVPKKSGFQIKEERIQKFLAVIEQAGEIKKIDVQRVLGWNDGVFERIDRAVRDRDPDIYVKKTKSFVWEKTHTPILEEKTIQVNS